MSWTRTLRQKGVKWSVPNYTANRCKCFAIAKLPCPHVNALKPLMFSDQVIGGRDPPNASYWAWAWRDYSTSLILTFLFSKAGVAIRTSDNTYTSPASRVPGGYLGLVKAAMLVSSSTLLPCLCVSSLPWESRIAHCSSSERVRI